jgi:hypothetical protein
MLAVAIAGLIGLAAANPASARQNAPNSALLQSDAAKEDVEPAIPGVANYASPYAQAAGLFDGGAALKAKNISSISHPATGIYCITVTNGVLTNSPPIVTVEWAHSLGIALFAQWNESKSDCAGGNKVYEVRTYKGDTGGVGSSLQTPVLSDLIAFVFVLP